MVNGVQGERRDPGRADGWRGRGAEVGERASLGVKFSGRVFILLPTPHTSVVLSFAVHIQVLFFSLQVAVSVPTRTLRLFPHARWPFACWNSAFFL